MNYTTLQILDTTSDLIELTYDLGAATRKYLVPALVAAYVAVTMALEYLRRPGRAKMVEALCVAYADLEAQDPSDMDTCEFRDWLNTLSDNELSFEFSGLR
jgi:hypothetical protein